MGLPSRKQPPRSARDKHEINRVKCQRAHCHYHCGFPVYGMLRACGSFAGGSMAQERPVAEVLNAGSNTSWNAYLRGSVARRAQTVNPHRIALGRLAWIGVRHQIVARDASQQSSSSTAM